MKSSTPIYSDTGHTGGWLFYSAAHIPIVTNLPFTRNALGDYSLNRTAAGAETYNVPITISALRRLIEASQIGIQEQFGGAGGGAGQPPGPSAGFPPFTGATQLTPATGYPAKGIQVTDVAVIYQVGVAGLTAASLSLNKIVFGNNLANVITNIPIDATALPLIVQANPYVITRAVTAPAYNVDDISDISVEFTFTMAGTGTIRVYGLGFHCSFNYN